MQHRLQFQNHLSLSSLWSALFACLADGPRKSEAAPWTGESPNERTSGDLPKSRGFGVSLWLFFANKEYPTPWAHVHVHVHDVMVLSGFQPAAPRIRGIAAYTQSAALVHAHSAWVEGCGCIGS